jgi:hypothetical protein
MKFAKLWQKACVFFAVGLLTAFSISPLRADISTTLEGLWENPTSGVQIRLVWNAASNRYDGFLADIGNDPGKHQCGWYIGQQMMRLIPDADIDAFCVEGLWCDDRSGHTEWRVAGYVGPPAWMPRHSSHRTVRSVAFIQMGREMRSIRIRLFHAGDHHDFLVLQVLESQDLLVV